MCRELIGRHSIPALPHAVLIGEAGSAAATNRLTAVARATGGVVFAPKSIEEALKVNEGQGTGGQGLLSYCWFIAHADNKACTEGQVGQRAAWGARGRGREAGQSCGGRRARWRKGAREKIVGTETPKPESDTLPPNCSRSSSWRLRCFSRSARMRRH